MNDTFSINRYYKLLQKELSERYPMIIKIASVFSLVLVGYWLTLLLTNSTPVSASSRSIYFPMALSLAMMIAPFNLYKNYNHRKKGVDYILLPASITEKFLSMQLICVIVLPLVVFISVLFTDIILSTISPSIFSGYAISGLWEKVGSFETVFKTLAFQQGCIFGNFIFRKNKIIKTFLSGIGLYIVIGLILAFILSIFFKGEFESLQNINIHIDNISQISIGLDGAKRYTIKGLYYFALAIYYFVLPAGFISGSYYKMKTQQY